MLSKEGKQVFTDHVQRVAPTRVYVNAQGKKTERLYAKTGKVVAP